MIYGHFCLYYFAVVVSIILFGPTHQNAPNGRYEQLPLQDHSREEKQRTPPAVKELKLYKIRH
jgi:hypothetical protein